MCTKAPIFPRVWGYLNQGSPLLLLGQLCLTFPGNLPFLAELASTQMIRVQSRSQQ